jgi:hypothetical protein
MPTQWKAWRCYDSCLTVSTTELHTHLAVSVASSRASRISLFVLGCGKVVRPDLMRRRVRTCTPVSRESALRFCFRRRVVSVFMLPTICDVPYRDK